MQSVSITLNVDSLDIRGTIADVCKALKVLGPDLSIEVKTDGCSLVEQAMNMRKAGYAVEFAEVEAKARKPRTTGTPKPDAPKKERRPRTTYTAEQQAEVVEWVKSNLPHQGRKTIPQAVERFGISGGLVRKWMKGTQG